MKPLIRVIALAGLALATAAHAQIDDTIGTTDVVARLQALKFNGDPMGFCINDPSFINSGAHHWQGVARHPDPKMPYMYAIASRAGCTQIKVIRFGSSDAKSDGRLRSNRLSPNADAMGTPPPATDGIVNSVDVNDHHGGSIQAAGKYLFVPGGLPCEGDSTYLYIYDISNPLVPTLVRTVDDVEAQTFLPFEMATAAVCIDDDGNYLIASDIGSTLRFFKLSANLSTWTRLNEVTLPEWPGTPGHAGPAPQGLQLINAAEDTSNGQHIYYFVALQNGQDSGIGQNHALIYRVGINGTITSISGPTDLQFSTLTYSTSGQHNGNWAAGGGLWVSPTGNILLYALEHNVTGQLYSSIMSEFEPVHGHYPPSVPADACTAHVTLFIEPNLGGKSLVIDALDRSRKNLAALGTNHEGPGGFANNVRSLTWRLPPGCSVRLYNGANFTGSYLEVGGFGTYNNLSTVPWTSGSGFAGNAIQSVQYIGASTPAPVVFLSPLPSVLLSNYIAPFPCAMLKLQAGEYTGPVIINQRVELRSTGGPVRIGG